jgi:hypothetical protein
MVVEVEEQFVSLWLIRGVSLEAWLDLAFV